MNNIALITMLFSLSYPQYTNIDDEQDVKQEFTIDNVIEKVPLESVGCLFGYVVPTLFITYGIYVMQQFSKVDNSNNENIGLGSMFGCALGFSYIFNGLALVGPLTSLGAMSGAVMKSYLTDGKVSATIQRSIIGMFLGLIAPVFIYSAFIPHNNPELALYISLFGIALGFISGPIVVIANQF